MKIFNNVMIGQKAFIVNDKKELLILKRQDAEIHDGVWDVPGGRVEQGQSLYEALTREIAEEVGLKLEHVILSIMASTFIGLTEGNPLLFYRSFFLCKARGKVKISKEHSEYKWINVSDLNKYQFQPDPDFDTALEKLVLILPKIDLNIHYSELG